ncbi:MAG: hypothetical protein ACTSRP_16030 [Candidatus Helarchaeota archaeon]
MVLNEDKHNLTWNLVKNRDSKTITRILLGSVSKMDYSQKIKVIYNLSSYK